MDASQFDRFTLSLRRRSVAGGLLALALGVSSSAAGKKKKKACPPCKKRKKGKCKANLPNGTACSGGTCQNGTCTAATCPPLRQCGSGCCPEGQVCGSNGACVDPSCCSDNAVCGSISTAGSLCCVAPRVAYCCCESPAGSDNGYMLCCDPNTNECPNNCARGPVQAGVNGTLPNAAGVCPHTPKNIVGTCT